MSTIEERRAADEQRLAELGYNQELEPQLERLPELRDLVHDHLDPRRLLHDLRPGVEQRRPDRDLLGLAADLDPDPDHRRSACPSSSRRTRPPAASTGGRPSSAAPAWGWFTGWFNLIGLIAVTASVDYGCATFLNTIFGLYDFNLFNGDVDDGALPARTFFLFLIILALHAIDQHRRQPPRRALQLDLGLVARRRRRGDPRRPDHRPRPARQRRLRLHRAHQQLGLRQRRCTGSTSCRSASC